MLQMRPLAAFRPYVEDVHAIIVLDVASALSEYIRSHRNFVNAASVGRGSFGASSTGSGDDQQEYISWVKDRVSETVDRLRLGTTERPSSFNNYVITIGNGYRFVVFRYSF